jgi:hypothetical protein
MFNLPPHCQFLQALASPYNINQLKPMLLVGFAISIDHLGVFLERKV